MSGAALPHTARPRAKVSVQPFLTRHSEGAGARPLHEAPYEQVKLDEAQRKKKGFMTVTLLRFELKWCFSNSNVHKNHLGIL